MVYKIATAAAFAAVMTAGTASATVHNFNAVAQNTASLTLNDGNFTVTATSGRVIPYSSTPARVTQTAGGLGVFTGGNDNGQIDGETIGRYEALTIKFDYAVRLVSFNLGAFDGNDDYEVFINGALIAYKDASTFLAGAFGASVTSFSVVAVGGLFTDGIFSGNDNFTLAGMETASVPLPGAAGLLALGLGALGAARRSRRKAA